MTKHLLLEKYGLFSAKVPRYTSYPPANHFQADLGHRNQANWLAAVPEGAAVSLYFHIPFCRRLCWFCACRTQGTSTLRPVDVYIESLLSELREVRSRLPGRVDMARLHLGGGTPTLLSPETMTRLLTEVFEAFSTAPGFEFSVEIDPTEAAPELIDVLAEFGMNRASIGVQDFEQKVQEAIGRLQTFQETQRVVRRLRDDGVKSLNLDLLYGLPYQNKSTLGATLEQVLDLAPDRLALYGYAHVPWMSKRQIMIPDAALPSTEERYDLSTFARDVLVGAGYRPLGIDHFVLPTDSLSLAADTGQMRRNFQGYTDDPADTLIGMGASAISRYPQGYVQNAVSTSAYAERVAADGLAGHKGYVLSPKDELIGDMIEELLCDGTLTEARLITNHRDMAAEISNSIASLHAAYPDVTVLEDGVLRLSAEYIALSRVIAGALDQTITPEAAHSAAV
ncbi:oxygen-independent coproporphyrinogen III oxidase [Ponticoccus sp. SC2-23]|uniref:oxygen-independent coproporphyrinogen III oxidase n=1 Tax=Alexandriicola marinus TaxID=2081710 RepID=UPI000FDB0964|nr:oxygen-independent coproporphyrinogen III oxidase [Alexandriicola marinus]MBM1219877.1 oxygen-independent coproporphyrinogen III oxidase [Ponticoccus sp. SC6-9]MBM1224563.1 oxygen-independent coproporphyrinogen III oxidase [Ponticoccus sp. SC6-15]MBM1228076.1 oxygen-independent coproporphyrinogen III oxidase [Ponticoccus sp. SC6-38]MBM1234286.1 oxygen-independent coproporphyrinogen III oxidase [Ponticoccus sp. SC6-45]MBM1238578.1 oxygen-independent coproporphyrinogen III oxidase [Ponticoccu